MIFIVTLFLFQFLLLGGTVSFPCYLTKENDPDTLRVWIIVGCQLIFVKSDPRKIGWGVIKAIGLLEETEIVYFSEKDLNSFSIRMRNRNGSVLAEKLFFENEYYCRSAKRQLQLSKQKLIQDKHAIFSKLLDASASMNNLAAYECIEFRKRNDNNGESSHNIQVHETEQSNKTLVDFD